MENPPQVRQEESFREIPLNPDAITITPNQTQNVVVNVVCKDEDDRKGEFKEKISNLLHRYNRYHQSWCILIFAITIALIACYFALNWQSKIDISTICTSYLLLDVLLRCEIFITILHFFIVKITFKKYFFNRMLHNIGGCHVGLGIGICVWIFLDVIFVHTVYTNLFTKITTVILLIILFVIIFTALPVIRRNNHDFFEKSHRYLGWLALFIYILDVFITDSIVNGQVDMIRDPSIIMLIIVFVIVFHPWFLIRRVNVEFQSPSTHCTAVTFKCNVKHVHGKFIRMSKNLREWHAFAIALWYPDEGKFKVVIASAGDWTKKLIARHSTKQDGKEPIKKLWIRRIFATGFMYSINAYHYVLIVSTGAGIAPALPYIQHPRVKTKLLWIAKDHSKTFGQEIMDIIKENEKNVVMLDTRVLGRPKPSIVIDYYKQFKVQAIFVVSNETFTYESIELCRKQGIECYGATWDS